MNYFRPFVPYRDRSLCFLDVETTGTIPGHHEVTEIGINHEKKGPLCLQVAPRHMDRAQPAALSVSRYNASDWAEAVEFRHVAQRVTEFTEDSTIVAHNAIFDVSMLKGEYDMAGLEHDHLFRDTIDTMALARTFLVPLGLNKLGLGACLKFIGEDYEEAHSAYGDCLSAEKLYRFIIENLKWHGKVNGKHIQGDLFG